MQSVSDGLNAAGMGAAALPAVVTRGTQSVSAVLLQSDLGTRRGTWHAPNTEAPSEFNIHSSADPARLVQSPEGPVDPSRSRVPPSNVWPGAITKPRPK